MFQKLFNQAVQDATRSRGAAGVFRKTPPATRNGRKPLANGPNRAPAGTDAVVPANVRPYRTLSLADLQNLTDETEGGRWLVDRFLRRAGLHVISASPGANKTWLALDLALHLASGTDWFGTPVTATPVLYVDEEMGAADIGERLRKLGHDPDWPFHYMNREGVKLNRPACVQRLVKTVEEKGIGLIIFDTMVCVHEYAESSNDDMSKLRRAILPLTNAGAALLFLHHNRKATGSGAPSLNDARGALDIVAMMDLAYSIHKPSRNTYRLCHTKPRLISEDEAWDINYVQEDSPDKTRTWLRAASSATPDGKAMMTIEERILAVVRERGEIQAGALYKAMGMRHDAVRNAAQAMCAAGTLRKVERPGRHGRAVCYLLP